MGWSKVRHTLRGAHRRQIGLRRVAHGWLTLGTMLGVGWPVWWPMRWSTLHAMWRGSRWTLEPWSGVDRSWSFTYRGRTGGLGEVGHRGLELRHGGRDSRSRHRGMRETCDWQWMGLTHWDRPIILADHRWGALVGWLELSKGGWGLHGGSSLAVDGHNWFCTWSTRVWSSRMRSYRLRS